MAFETGKKVVLLYSDSRNGAEIDTVNRANSLVALSKYYIFEYFLLNRSDLEQKLKQFSSNPESYKYDPQIHALRWLLVHDGVSKEDIQSLEQ